MNDDQGAQQQGTEGSPLIPLTWEEVVLVNAHKSAVEKALESSDGACATILTACFSLATAYGAVIALVTPKNDQATLLVVAPFVLLAAGAVIALVGKASGISLKNFGEIKQTKEHVQRAVGNKRKASWLAVALAAAGVVVAGYVVYATYSEPAVADAGSDEVVLTISGQAHFQTACGTTVKSVKGAATFADPWVTIKLAEASAQDCPDIDELTLPTAAVAYVRTVP